MSYSTWRKLTQMNCNWTGKLEVNKLCSHTFKASSKEIIVICSEKIKHNTSRRMCERAFFVNLQHSHKKWKDSLETRAVYIEIFLVSWNLPNGPKHRGSILRNECQFCTILRAPSRLVSEVWDKYKDVPTKILKVDTRTNSS